MRLTRNVLLLVAWVSGLLLVALAFLWLRGCRAERLAQAHMLDELQAVRGGAEGVRYEQTKDPMDAHLMLVLDDGSWLVMAYWEMDHCLPRRALTLVKDSEGRYYQSDRQFRGKFTHYRRMLRMLEDARQIHDRPRERFLAEELSKDEIHMIARCRDLAEAMKIMEQSGFKAMKRGWPRQSMRRPTRAPRKPQARHGRGPVPLQKNRRSSRPVPPTPAVVVRKPVSRAR